MAEADREGPVLDVLDAIDAGSVVLIVLEEIEIDGEGCGKEHSPLG